MYVSCLIHTKTKPKSKWNWRDYPVDGWMKGLCVCLKSILLLISLCICTTVATAHVLFTVHNRRRTAIAINSSKCLNGNELRRTTVGSCVVVVVVAVSANVLNYSSHRSARHIWQKVCVTTIRGTHTATCRSHTHVMDDCSGISTSDTVAGHMPVTSTECNSTH